jgi:hypothetical protein
VQTDNGAELRSKFHWHLDELDTHQVYIKPRTPRLNGKFDRSHRVDSQEFYQPLDKVTSATISAYSTTKAVRMGELLQLQSHSWRLEWTNALQTATSQEEAAASPAS